MELSYFQRHCNGSISYSVKAWTFSVCIHHFFTDLSLKTYRPFVAAMSLHMLLANQTLQLVQAKMTIILSLRKIVNQLA